MNMEDLIYPPDESLAKLIKAEINEVDDAKLEHNVQLFEKWIECQPHLPKNYTKQMLTSFIRGTKHDLEQAKKKFEIYFVGKNKIHPVFTYYPYSKEELKIAENFAVFASPHLSQDGYRVIIMRVQEPNPDLFEVKVTINNGWKVAHLRMCTEPLIAGDIYVIDCKNISPAMIPKLLTREFKEAVFLTQASFACRIKQIHFINAPGYMDKVVTMMKLIVNEKLRKRIFVDQGIAALQKCVHKKSLPKDYGGDGESIDVSFAKWMKRIEERKDWYIKENEAKATGPVPKHLVASLGSENDFGADGSFRKLVID